MYSSWPQSVIVYWTCATESVCYIQNNTRCTCMRIIPRRTRQLKIDVILSTFSLVSLRFKYSYMSGFMRLSGSIFHFIFYQSVSLLLQDSFGRMVRDERLGKWWLYYFSRVGIITYTLSHEYARLKTKVFPGILDCNFAQLKSSKVRLPGLHQL